MGGVVEGGGRRKREEIEIMLKKENPNVVVVVDSVERCSVSSTWSSSSSSYDDDEWEAGGMVKIEIDAARALADFAHFALLESSGGGNPNNGESTRKWGHKRRRSEKKSVKNEMAAAAAGDWGCSVESSPNFNSGDLVDERDRALEALPRDKKLCKNVAIKTIKAEQDFELPTTTSTGPRTCVAIGGGKSKQHLTEEEKEARKLRRILANRESARQTIRRRQAMCEELTRKAADLALDNESMKREKELIMKKYQLLKDKNSQLKEQIARKIKAEAKEAPEKNQEGLPSNPVEATSSSIPLLGYNGPPYTPYIWPPIIQPFAPVQTQAIAQTSTSSQDPVAATANMNSSHKQRSPMSSNGPRPSFYLVPCPWFYPLPNHGNQLHPHPLDTGGLRIKQGDSVCSEHNIEPPYKPMIDASTCTEANIINSVHKASTRLATDEGGHTLSSHPEGMILMPPPLRSVKPEDTFDCKGGVQHETTSTMEPVPSTDGHVGRDLSEDKQESDGYPSKKLGDAAAAAEARKRRKELTKLKNYNSRQLKLRC